MGLCKQYLNDGQEIPLKFSCLVMPDTQMMQVWRRKKDKLTHNLIFNYEHITILATQGSLYVMGIISRLDFYYGVGSYEFQQHSHFRWEHCLLSQKNINLPDWLKVYCNFREMPTVKLILVHALVPFLSITYKLGVLWLFWKLRHCWHLTNE